MTGPQIYRAISKVIEELSVSGIPKRHTNEEEHYKYRSIDDLLNRLAPILAKQKVCVLPRVIEREAVQLDRACGDRIGSVLLRVAFDLVSARDGSTHTIEAYGEAFDAGDKGTSKAMSAAFKTAVVQAFCIPVAGLDDADATSPRAVALGPVHQPEPDGGWEAWTQGITDIVDSCQSEEALRRLQETHREKLKGLSRERRELYDSLGAAFASRAAALAGNQSAPAPIGSCPANPYRQSENAVSEATDLANA